MKPCICLVVLRLNLSTGVTINSEILEFQGKEIQDDVILEQKQTSYKYTMNLSTPATIKKKQMKEKRELLNKKP